MSDVTRILSQIEEGDGKASDELLPLVYEELRQLAAVKMAQEKPDLTLQPTALAPHWHSRGHFFAAAAEAMRRILVESARRKASSKRGGKSTRVELEEVGSPHNDSPVELLALNEALDCPGPRRSDQSRAGEAAMFRRAVKSRGGRCVGDITRNC